jgi:hypothetical protein
MAYLSGVFFAAGSDTVGYDTSLFLMNLAEVKH